MTRRDRTSTTESRVARAVALVGVLLAACATPSRTAFMSTQPAGLVEHRGSPFYSPIVELRQYTLHPGRRDDLIRLFDAEFIEPQEQVGMKVIGQFRNLDDPNKFVWLRGFADMDVRARGLTQFYSGNAWRSRRNDANATIIDNDNVLLLHPVRPDAAFDLDGLQRPPAGATSLPSGLVVATIYHIDPTPEKERSFVQFFDSAVAPVFRAAGAPVIAELVPERTANNFPRLPVREREPVFVWFSRFESVEAYERFQAVLGSMPSWRDSLAAELSSRVREPYVLRLTPTARSLLK